MSLTMKAKDMLKRVLRNWQRILFGIFDPAARLGLVLVVGGTAAVLCLWIFMEFAEELLGNDLAIFDAYLTELVHYVASPFTTGIMKLISNAGHWIFLSIVGFGVSVYFYRKQHFWDAVIVQICLWGGFLFNCGLKYFFKRERPSLERLVDAGGFSFPSGHSMVCFAFYGMLIYLAYINLSCSLWRTALMILISCFILMIGVSRIYLGVHFPSDVAAGFAAGGVWLTVCIVALEAVRHYREKKHVR